MPIFSKSRKTVLGTAGACLGLLFHHTIGVNTPFMAKSLEFFATVSSVQIKVLHVLFVVGFFFVNLLKWLIFGRLTENELRILKDKVNYTIWEFVLGFLVLYDSSPRIKNIRWHAAKYAGLFTCVVLVKCFHYLAADRVHTIHYCPRSPLLSSPHVRLRLAFGLALIMLIQSLLIFRYFYDVSLQNHVNGNVLLTVFGYEILSHVPLTMITSVHFALNLYESRNSLQADPKWNHTRIRIVFFTDFIFALLRFSMSCIFTLLFMYYYTFPVHTMPSSYACLKAAVNKARRLVNLRKQELLLLKLKHPDHIGLDATCIICYDDLAVVDLHKALCIRSCGHIFHRECLRLWFNTAPTCPICRSKV